MRQLKFRAWDERQLIMHNNFQFIQSGEEGNDWVVFTSDKQHNFADATKNPFFSQQLKKMQFTGRLDAEDKEVYEGDIVENWEVRGVIMFKDGGFIIHSDKPFHTQAGIYSQSPNYFIDMIDTCKILGNIYQNPELIKK